MLNESINGSKKDRVPWMKAILDYFLAIFPPFVTIIKNIHITPCLEAESWLPKLPSHLHLALI